jgi:hypothetical protein
MGVSKLWIAKRVAIAYAVVGFSYFLLWHFVLTPIEKENSVLIVLFYIFLPAALVLPYLICEAADELVRRRKE